MLAHCEFCNAVVQVNEIASFVSQNEHDFLDSTKYTFAKCEQCYSPLLFQQELFFYGQATEWGEYKRIFPSNMFHINPVIPEQLQKALSECIQCYKAGAFTATAIMCRRTIEGFCSNKGIEESNLAKSIRRLKEEGIINEQLYEWANQLRLVGNEAAHNIEANFSSQDAKDILDFTIAILDFTYSFKEKFDQFKSRINNLQE